MKNNEVLLETIGEIREDMVWDARPQARVRRFTVRRALILAAALVMCFALAVTGMAAADVGGVYQALYRISPEIAQRLKPVRMSCEDAGIRMEVLSACVSGNVAEVYIELQDLTGQRLDESIDLFDSYSIHTAFDCEMTCAQVSRDAEGRNATFLITITGVDEAAVQGEKVTFSLNKLLTGKQEFSGEVPVALASAGSAENVQSDVKLRGYGGDEAHIPQKFLAVDEDAAFRITDGVFFNGMGYVDGTLHVQLRFADILETDNHGYVYLINGAGESVYDTGSASFWDGDDSCEEYVFDIAPDQLAEYRLWGEFVTCDTQISGDWEVTFPLESAQ